MIISPRRTGYGEPRLGVYVDVRRSVPYTMYVHASSASVHCLREVIHTHTYIHTYIVHKHTCRDERMYIAATSGPPANISTSQEASVRGEKRAIASVEGERGVV